jgi:hypothetical protein
MRLAEDVAGAALATQRQSRVMDGLRCSITGQVDLSEAAVRVPLEDGVPHPAGECEGLLGVTECLLRLAGLAQNARDGE